jgi:hypothetical protein
MGIYGRRAEKKPPPPLVVVEGDTHAKGVFAFAAAAVDDGDSRSLQPPPPPPKLFRLASSVSSYCVSLVFFLFYRSHLTSVSQAFLDRKIYPLRSILPWKKKIGTIGEHFLIRNHRATVTKGPL